MQTHFKLDHTTSVSASELHFAWISLAGDLPWQLFKKHLRNLSRTMFVGPTREVTKKARFYLRRI
jgi:hypothetical protein